MTRKPILLTIEPEIYEKFSAVCKAKFMIRSRLVEDFMKKFIEKHS